MKTDDTRRCTREQGKLLHSLFSEIFNGLSELIAESFKFKKNFQKKGMPSWLDLTFSIN